MEFSVVNFHMLETEAFVYFFCQHWSDKLVFIDNTIMYKVSFKLAFIHHEVYNRQL